MFTFPLTSMIVVALNIHEFLARPVLGRDQRDPALGSLAPRKPRQPLAVAGHHESRHLPLATQVARHVEHLLVLRTDTITSSRVLQGDPCHRFIFIPRHEQDKILSGMV
jgi:hypothetical protein